MKKKTVAPQKSPPIVSSRQALNAARREILRLSGEQALARILNHPLPASLVQSFAETDLHLLIHEIGVADALPLVAMASNDQLEYLLDAEVWNKDRLDNASLTRWLATMVQADAGRMIPYLARCQPELVKYFLWRNLQLIVREHDEDPSTFGDDFFTLDDVFYLRIVPESVPDDLSEGIVEDRDGFIRDFLERLADHDYEYFRNLLLESAALLSAEHEEDALRQRTVRLAEKGFLPFDEAVGVYQPLAPEDLAARGRKRFDWKDEDGNLFPVPCYAAGALPGRGALAEALAVCATRGDLDILEAEFAGLCNRIALADNRPVSERTAIAAVVRKAAGYIGIGLESLAVVEGCFDPGRGADLLCRHSLGDLFRVGYGTALKLKWKTDRWQRGSWYRRRGLKLSFWLEEGMGILGGLLLKRPLFFDNYRSGVLYREFETRSDVDATARALDNILAIDALLAKIDPAAAMESATGPLNWKNLLLTLWVRDSLGLDFPGLKIGLGDLRTFFVDMWTAKGKIRQKRRRRFLRWLAQRSGQAPETVSQTLAAVLETLFKELEDEYGRVAPETLDRRFIGLFLIA